MKFPTICHVALMTGLIGLAITGPCAAAPQYVRDKPQVPQDKAPDGSVSEARGDIQSRLERSLSELTELRERISDEIRPLSAELRALEAELSEQRREFEQVTRQLDRRTLDLTNLKARIDRRKEDLSYLSNLLGEYVRSFETRLHIAELQRYQADLEAARLAPENQTLSTEEVFQQQSEVLELSLDRLEEALDGTRFKGTAVGPDSLIRRGEFLLVGPSALFKADDDDVAGTAELMLGSVEPTEITFADPEDGARAASLVVAGEGLYPFDPTLGNAHKIEATEETLIEHIQKAGPVGIPIVIMAGLALIVALWKWITLLCVRKPSRGSVLALLKAVSKGNGREVADAASRIRGPAGRMLRSGVENMNLKPALVEEIMYEQVLVEKTRLNRWLPFIAICAASAPLLGLLGTVTGIIDTFKMITVFGSGDVKSLSGGISAALITTEFGLVVAIPSLILHAWLSRKARGITDGMEQSAISFMNQIGISRNDARPTEPDSSEQNPPVEPKPEQDPEPEDETEPGDDTATEQTVTGPATSVAKEE